MTKRSIVVNALVALLCAVCFSAQPSFAQSITIDKRGSSQSINVPMNRALVLNSDTSFSELSIANPSIADFSTLSDRTVYILGKAPGITTLTLLDELGQLISNVEVKVTADITEFKERLKQILPNENIEVRTANDGIVLSGTVQSAVALGQALELAERYAPSRVLNLMSVGGQQQVMLKVRFAEVQRSISKALSASLGVSGDLIDNNLGTRIGSGHGSNNDGREQLLQGSVPSGAPRQGTALFGFNIGAAEVGVLLEALETKGFVRSLAEPNLSALSGKTASFLAGGEFPIPGVDGGIEYKPVGITLDFTPIVLQDNIISLDVGTAVSAIDSTLSMKQDDNITVFGLKKREAKTTVQLRDGESFAIAGLIKDDFRDLNSQVPWLGDIPILGALFRSADYNREQSELVIIITAHLVSPVRGDALALPTDRIAVPTEKDLFLFGKTAGSSNRTNNGVGEVARQDFNSSYGYLMD